MLRAIVALLLLANVVFFVWARGGLDKVVGVRAMGDREPERLVRQVRPEAVRILTAQAVAAAASAAESRLVCLEAGPFSTEAIAAAEAAVSAILPSGTWARHTSETPARWIVYMGRYASREAQQRKAQELVRLNVSFDEVSGMPALEPGLSLGQFNDREVADAARAQLALRGIHTAKLVELNGASSTHMLRVQRADTDLAAKVAGLKLDALGKGFVVCAKPS